MGVQICQASVFHSPGISAKLFSKKGRKMAATLASLLVIASLAHAKPQVGFGFPSPSSSTTSLEQRVPNTCTTLTGGTCIFPFTYNGATHYQCTYTDSPTPWCATAVDSSGVVVTNGWGDCEVSATSACQTESITVPTCTTTSGPRPGQSCVFPFRHLGVVYNSCTSVGQSAPWCSTSTTSAGTHIDGEYGFCPSTCPTESSSSVTTTTTAAPSTTTTTPSSSTSCIPGSIFPQDCNVCVCDSLGVSVCTTNSCGTFSAVSGPAAGSACVFPFTYGGVTHQSCAEWVYGGEHQGKYWCSTKVDPTGTHVNGEGNYGFCSSECSGAPREFETVSRFRSASSSSSAVSFGGASVSSRSRSPRRPF